MREAIKGSRQREDLLNGLDPIKQSDQIEYIIAKEESVEKDVIKEERKPKKK